MDFEKIVQNFEPLWGSWKFGELIGEGSSSEVYKIKRIEFGKEFTAALKIISIPSEIHNFELKKLNSNNSIEFRENYIHNVVKNIINEISLLYDLKGHSNIISYEDHMIKKYSDEIWLIFIRLELAQPLNQYIAENKFTIRNTLKLGVDLCSALDTTHSKNVIHGDIRESNIFVSKNNTFKLGNFNLQNNNIIPDTIKKKVGTLNYTPPEVFTENKYFKNSDIYSLGIVIYKLLNNGKFPFSNNTTNTEIFFENLLNTHFEPPENSFGELSDIILKSCAINPNERYQTAEDFKNDLLKIIHPDREIHEFLSTTLEHKKNSKKQEKKKSYFWRGVEYKRN
jgi:serine/threonine protein kinase